MTRKKAKRKFKNLRPSPAATAWRWGSLIEAASIAGAALHHWAPLYLEGANKQINDEIADVSGRIDGLLRHLYLAHQVWQTKQQKNERK